MSAGDVLVRVAALLRERTTLRARMDDLAVEVTDLIAQAQRDAEGQRERVSARDLLGAWGTRSPNLHPLEHPMIHSALVIAPILPAPVMAGTCPDCCTWVGPRGSAHEPAYCPMRSDVLARLRREVCQIRQRIADITREPA